MTKVVRKILQAARLYDVPFEWMLAMAWVESHLDPAAVNSSSGAKGLYQFVPSTAREYNINPLNLPSACGATALMITKNRQGLEAAGKPVTMTSVYLAHQQGLKGVVEIYDTLEGKVRLLPSRLKNMQNNIHGVILVPQMGDAKIAETFVGWWETKLNAALLAARKAQGG